MRPCYSNNSRGQDGSFERALSRRQFLERSAAGMAALGGLWTLPARGEEDPRKLLPPIEIEDASAKAPTAPVALERCRSFELEAMAEVLSSLLDRIGGIESLVKGKTVTVKLNTTGHGRQGLHGKPSERTYQTHPNMVEVLCGLFRRAGARRIYLVESFYEEKPPEEILASQGWKIERIHSAAEHITAFEDTRHQGAFKDYVRLPVPWGGFVYPAYHLNRRFADTDVLVSLAKLKNHITAGITGAVKNLFGITPTSLYGEDAPNERSITNRAENLHYGARTAPAGVTQDRYSGWDRLPNKTFTSYYRVPRVTADVFGLRPPDLSIVEGVESSKGGEGPWCPRARPVEPGVILAGRNAVTVDAIATAVMGYDPLAKSGEKPWYGDNHLELLARAGMGTHDPGRIEVIGLPLKEALYEYEPNLDGWIRRHAST